MRLKIATHSGHMPGHCLHESCHCLHESCHCLHESHFLEAFCSIVTACRVYATPHSSWPVSITQVQLPSVYELPVEHTRLIILCGKSGVVWGPDLISQGQNQGGLGLGLETLAAFLCALLEFGYNQ